MIKTIKAYECMNSVSLDKDYLNQLSNGKEKVNHVSISGIGCIIDDLEARNKRSFNFTTYYDLQENDDSETYAYFTRHCKCINADELEEILFL